MRGTKRYSHYSSESIGGFPNFFKAFKNFHHISKVLYFDIYFFFLKYWGSATVGADLKYVMGNKMVKRIKCKNLECEGQILLATAEKTGGYSMPCIQKKQREERERYIRENRKDVNLFDGITDYVEIIKIINSERKHVLLINYLPYSKSIECYLDIKRSSVIIIFVQAEGFVCKIK